MLTVFLPAPLIGALTFVAFLFSLIIWGCLILPAAVLKLLVPLPAWRRLCSRYAVRCASQWVATNQWIVHLLHPQHWQLDIRGELDPHKNYLLVCNHQEWTDIVVLFNAFHVRVPLLRFFLKYELLYVPLIGTSCWAMDFPFMKRHTREQVAANPALRAQDLETTRRSCEIYRSEPVTVVNFLEGTRFSESKRLAHQSPYRHLLRPKSAGVSFALNAMGEQFAGLIDVTLAYRDTGGKSLLWSWLCGEQGGLILRADLMPIPQDLLHGDYEGDPEFRARFQAWVNDLWSKKDAGLERLLRQAATPPARPAHHF